MLKPYLYFIPAIIWAIIIFALSTNTPVDIGPVDWLDFLSIDKAGHLVFYFIFCVLVCFGFAKIRQQAHFSTTYLIVSFGVVFIYGVIMELLQLKFYEGRQLEYMDMVANGIGAFLGAIIYQKFLFSRLKVYFGSAHTKI